jgi:Holliday junction resolvase RusA-like endonuclease
MAVNNKHPVRPSRRRLRIGIEVLKLRKREVVVDPASRRDSDNLITR